MLSELGVSGGQEGIFPLVAGLTSPLLFFGLLSVFKIFLRLRVFPIKLDNLLFVLLIGLSVTGFVVGVWLLFKKNFKLRIILGVVLTGGVIGLYGFWEYSWRTFSIP